jgi:hypothetical protein
MRGEFSYWLELLSYDDVRGLASDELPTLQSETTSFVGYRIIIYNSTFSCLLISAKALYVWRFVTYF